MRFLVIALLFLACSSTSINEAAVAVAPEGGLDADGGSDVSDDSEPVSAEAETAPQDVTSEEIVGDAGSDETEAASSEDASDPCVNCNPCSKPYVGPNWKPQCDSDVGCVCACATGLTCSHVDGGWVDYVCLNPGQPC